jgi:hypothetical protein
MPTPLQPGDHYILHKLCNELLPWMIAGRAARRQWFVVLARLYSYGGELAAALAGLGIGAPVIAVFAGKGVDGENALVTLRRALPGPWFAIGVVALVLWIVVRLVVKQQNAVVRALYAQDCSKTMLRLSAELWNALPAPNPLPGLAPLQEAVQRAVGDAIDKDVWPWNPPQPRGRAMELELARQISEIRTQFMTGWTPPPAGGV